MDRRVFTQAAVAALAAGSANAAPDGKKAEIPPPPADKFNADVDYLYLPG